MNRQNLKAIFQKYPVESAYLFGSRSLKGVGPCTRRYRAGPGSDIDIGVYVSERAKNRLDLRLRIIGELKRALKNERIDLVILNDAPLLLKFKAIQPARIIFSKNEKRRVEFEFRVMSLYYDQEYYYHRHADLAIERMAKEGIL